MTMLSDRAIRHALTWGRIGLHPLPDLTVCLGSCSIDLTLSSYFLRFPENQAAPLDLANPESLANRMELVLPKADHAGPWFPIYPGGFLLASTREALELPNDLSARLEGRSSIARLGLTVHSTAALIEPGWIGTITMEISNLGPLPIILRPGMRICALTFHEMSDPVLVPYREKPGNKYAGQTMPRESRIVEDEGC